MNKNLKYFCRSCKTVKLAKFVIIFPEDSNGNRDKGQEIEVLKTFVQNVKSLTSEAVPDKTKEIHTRQLECGHFVQTHIVGFTDYSTENLNEQETAQLRREIDRTMIGKNAKQLEEVILFHCDQYQTLLKIASKQKQQAKYAIQYLDQIRERYSKTLSNEDDKQSFETKFAHFLDLKPTTNKVIERERTSVERAADKQKSALEAVKALLGKSGYKAKDLFNQKDGE